MRTVYTLLLLLLGLLLATPSSADLFAVDNTGSNTVTVDLPGYGYSTTTTTLGTAMSAVAPGDTIYVAGQVFLSATETLDVSSLMWTGPLTDPPTSKLTTIAASGTPAVTVTIAGANSTIQYLTFDSLVSGDTGIALNSAFGLTIQNCRFEGLDAAITTTGSNVVSVTIDSCSFIGNNMSGTGYILLGADPLTIGTLTFTNNTLDPTGGSHAANKHQMWVYGPTTSATIANNSFLYPGASTGEAYTLQIQGANGSNPQDVQFYGNEFTITENSSSGSVVGLWLGSTDTTDGDVRSSKFYNNVFSGTPNPTNDVYGVLVYRDANHSGTLQWAQNLQFVGNRFEGGTWGMRVWGNLRRSAITHSYFLNVERAIEIRGLRYSTVVGNYFDQCGSAIYQTAIDANKLHNVGNVFAGNYFHVMDEPFTFADAALPATGDSTNVYTASMFLGATSPTNNQIGFAPIALPWGNHRGSLNDVPIGVGYQRLELNGAFGWLRASRGLKGGQ